MWRKFHSPDADRINEFFDELLGIIAKRKRLLFEQMLFLCVKTTIMDKTNILKPHPSYKNVTFKKKGGRTFSY